MSENVKADIQKIATHESLLVFPRFDESVAWQVGNLLRKAAEDLGQPVAIDIRRGDDCLFFTAMQGTSPANADWARRKRNLTNKLQQSSYAIGLMRDTGTDLMALMALDPRDHTPHGGCFPIRVTGAGMVGTITVSGLPQRDDHKLVIDVLSDFLRVPLGEASF
jgi:uncharacterized protein (UPF0303 family)